MKIVNVKMSGKDKFYLVEVDYIKGMNAYYSTGYYASGYYAICMPITLKEGVSEEVEELTFDTALEYLVDVTRFIDVHMNRIFEVTDEIDD